MNFSLTWLYLTLIQSVLVICVLLSFKVWNVKRVLPFSWQLLAACSHESLMQEMFGSKTEMIKHKYRQNNYFEKKYILIIFISSFLYNPISIASNVETFLKHFLKIRTDFVKNNSLHIRVYVTAMASYWCECKIMLATIPDSKFFLLTTKFIKFTSEHQYTTCKQTP